MKDQGKLTFYSINNAKFGINIDNRNFFTYLISRMELIIK